MRKQRKRETGRGGEGKARERERVSEGGEGEISGCDIVDDSVNVDLYRIYSRRTVDWVGVKSSILD